MPKEIMFLMTVSYDVPVTREALGLHQMCNSYISSILYIQYLEIQKL